MGYCLVNNETRYFSLILLFLKVYAEHLKYKEKKPFDKQRAEDYKKQAEDQNAQFSVLIRAKTAKKKIATLVKPENMTHFMQALNKVLHGAILKNAEVAKEESKIKKKKEAKKGEEKEEQKESAQGTKKFKSK